MFQAKVMQGNFFIQDQAISASQTPVLSLQGIKNFLNIDSDDLSQDLTLTMIYNCVIDYAEVYTGRSFRMQDKKLIIKDYIPRQLYLPYSPVISVNNISLTDSYGNLIKIDLVNQCRIFTEIAYLEFLNVTLPNNGLITIQYSAGYSNLDLIPGSVKQGMLCQIASIYKDDKTSEYKDYYDTCKDIKMIL